MDQIIRDFMQRGVVTCGVIFATGGIIALMAGESGPRSGAQMRRSACLRKLTIRWFG